MTSPYFKPLPARAWTRLLLPGLGLLLLALAAPITPTARGGVVSHSSGVISIISISAPPVITSATTVTTRIGEAFQYQITADNNPTSFAASGLPEGLSCDPSTGLISGTTTASGFTTVVLVAYKDGTNAGISTLVINTQAKLVVSALGYGTVNFSGTTYHDDGESVTLIADRGNGGAFMGWWGDLGFDNRPHIPEQDPRSSSANPLTITVHNSMAIEAMFNTLWPGDPSGPVIILPAPPGLPATVTVNASRGGSVSPSGAMSAHVGDVLGLHATPAKGYLFTYWLARSGSSALPSVVYGNDSLFHGSLLVVGVDGDAQWTAQFARWSDYAGRYLGVVSGTDGQPCGKVSVVVDRRGGYSANVVMNGVRQSCSGNFDADSTISMRLKHGPWRSLDLYLDLSGLVPKFNGWLTEYSAADFSAVAWSLPASAEFLGSYHRASLCPQSGYYTAVLASSTTDQVAPMGMGYLTMRVSDSGNARLSGRLADGTPFAGSSAVTLAGDLPVFAAPYGKKGSLIGSIHYADTGAGKFLLSGILQWQMPTPNSQVISVSLEGGTYQPGKPLDGSTGSLSFSGGDLGRSFTEAFTLDRNGKPRLSLEDAHSATVHLNTQTGLFFGSFKDRARLHGFKGAVLQQQNRGAGFFLRDQVHSGAVDLEMNP